jgi:hypothetical protein
MYDACSVIEVRYGLTPRSAGWRKVGAGPRSRHGTLDARRPGGYFLRMRRLLVTRRVVPLDRLDEYLPAWADVVRTARTANCRAWLFRQTDHQDHFLEFVEWKDDEASESARAPLETARRIVDETFGYGDSTEWEEA